MDDREYANEHERQMAIAEAEQLSRRDEALANIKARLAVENAQNPDVKTALKEAIAEQMESAHQAEELRRTNEIKDLSGTRADLTDSSGNLAPNAEVANAGGTGVEASNSKGGEQGAAQAKTAEQTKTDEQKAADKKAAEAPKAGEAAKK